MQHRIEGEEKYDPFVQQPQGVSDMLSVPSEIGKSLARSRSTAFNPAG